MERKKHVLDACLRCTGWNQLLFIVHLIHIIRALWGSCFIYPKPYSIYLRGTIGFRVSGILPTVPHQSRVFSAGPYPDSCVFSLVKVPEASTGGEILRNSP